jgi:hypothetical protein
LRETPISEQGTAGFGCPVVTVHEYHDTKGKGKVKISLIWAVEAPRIARG